jgi:hypothetical protein
LAAALIGGSALAHDTWLEQRSGQRSGAVELALTTGELFPRAETPVAAEALTDRGCIGAAGTRVPLSAGELSVASLALHAQAPRGEPLGSCWVQTIEFDVVVAPALVPVYLREIGASKALHDAWAEQQRAGLPWTERYAKHARISFAASDAPIAGSAGAADGGKQAATAANERGRVVAPPARPAAVERHAAPPPMAFEIEAEQLASLRAGDTVRFRVLRDGQPLAGQAVELRGDVSRLGLWRRTDEQGRASVPVPVAGRWVLRATDLRPVPGRAGHWESRFATHTFTVASAPAGARVGPAARIAQSGPVQPAAQIGTPSMSNAR